MEKWKDKKFGLTNWRGEVVKFMKKTRCPYCGKRLNYFQAFMERKHGEYKCHRCGRSSTVYFSNVFKLIVIVAVILAIILVIIFTTPKFIQNLWGMLWVAIPFLIIYLITPFFVRLVPIKKKRKSINYEQFGEASGAPSTRTKIAKADDSTDSDGFMDISHLE